MSGRLWACLSLSVLLFASLWSSSGTILQAPENRALIASPPIPGTAPATSRVTNTPLGLKELLQRDSAILLENASLDTARPRTLEIPEPLRAGSNPGAYIVQGQGADNARLKSILRQSGAIVVSYIPNNAWLARLSPARAEALVANPGVRAVLPFEPFYKIRSTLLPLALNPPRNHGELELNLLLFPDATESLPMPPSIRVVHQEPSPFGTVLRVRCAAGELANLARLPEVQAIEPASPRTPTTDLTRQSLLVASNSVTHLNYLGLTGSNVLVGLVDTGVDASHPDLTNRVLYAQNSTGQDPNGHGTLVAGIIAGSGSKSVRGVPGSVTPVTNNQFRGIAPAARLFAIENGPGASHVPDAALQETLARTNALISNNSWLYDAPAYDLAAASYDAAVRDAIPTQSGPQPLLFVFPAGNRGAGLENGTAGFAGTVQSPATAKNVVTVGALEQFRTITNEVCGSDPSWLAATDSSNQVASFSARGNVGIGIEGPAGRIKPDIMAPGVFVVGPRSSTWDETAYYSETNFPACPNYAPALSNLNRSVSPFYRLESGTSLAAGSVAGTLALIHQFCLETLSRTNSPALMKALLINGARPLPNTPAATSTTNLQGWGMVQLPNSIPPGLTNLSAAPLLFFDQDPATAVSTAQGFTRTISFPEPAQTLPLKITLTWTDPPGNPVASLKLVNDLDLVVTNLTTGAVFLGNDLDLQTGANHHRTFAHPAFQDRVNNVENVILPAAAGTNFSITVRGRGVNVNTIGSSDNALQDYALVLSSGDAFAPGAMELLTSQPDPTPTESLTVITNFDTTAEESTAFLLQERIGEPPGHWRFYVLTNDTGFTNAAFFTFAAPTAQYHPWRPEADIDLYVSLDATLLQLNPEALTNAFRSTTRHSLESIVITNNYPSTYYIAIKCESKGAAEFNFAASFRQSPFFICNENGVQELRELHIPTLVPPGTPAQPGLAHFLAVATEQGPLSRVIVTNTASTPHLGSYSATLRNHQTEVLLKGFSNAGPATNHTTIYDDSPCEPVTGSIPTQGPGSLLDFQGAAGSGAWLLTGLSTNAPVTNEAFGLMLDYYQDLRFGVISDILPGACRQEFLDVPLNATSVVFTVSLRSDAGPVLVEIAPRDGPPGYAQSLVLQDWLTNKTVVLDAVANPPLVPGPYQLRLLNQGTGPALVEVVAAHSSTPTAPDLAHVVSSPNLKITDEATTTHSLHVTNSGSIFAVEAGLHIEHPRVSDLAIGLISPKGTRALLFENRGGNSTNGLGTQTLVTNIVPVSSSGGPKAYTNSLDMGRTAATLTINYDFYSLPDFMRVYYENTLLFDSGMVSGSGSTNLSFGPGTSTILRIVMNEGDNYDPDTAWFYSVTSSRAEPVYATFSEINADTPIKFAIPPFDDTNQNGMYYLPETSLDPFKGESVTGEWQLEIRDTRHGAATPEPRLKSWRLSFMFSDPAPVPLPLMHDLPRTNRLSPGRIQWFTVDTPTWAGFATNQLLFSSAPVNLWFNSNSPPAGTNANDCLLAHTVLARSVTLATNSNPALSPGTVYYLGIENTNTTPVEFAFVVRFDVTPLEPGMNLVDPAGRVPRYFSFDVSTNATAAEFQMSNSNGNADLVLSRGLPFPTAADYLEGSFNPGSYPESIILFSDSPEPLAPGRWYMAVVGGGSTGTYTVRAEEYTNAWPQITRLLSGSLQHGMNNAAGMGADYYRFSVTPNAVRAHFEVVEPSAEVALLVRRGLPLPSEQSFDAISANPGTNAELLVLTATSQVPLQPGDWFLTVLNISGGPLDYGIKATEYASVPADHAVLSSEVVNESLCLTWSALPGGHYYVEGAQTLEPLVWDSLSGTLTPVGSAGSFCVTLPTPYEFFRLREGLLLTPEPEQPVIRSLKVDETSVLLEWTASADNEFQVQWSPSLVEGSWTAFAHTAVSVTGLFRFTDDGSETGGLANNRFYRLVRVAGD